MNVSVFPLENVPGQPGVGEDCVLVSTSSWTGTGGLADLKPQHI